MTQFRDMIYQTVKSPSAPNAGIPIGGINPAQVGLGVTVGSIETIHTGGSQQNTGVREHMAIDGAGYFVVKNGQQTFYTRAGDFILDRDGNLCMSGNGYKVQGYAYKDTIDPATGNTVRMKDTQVSDINIPLESKIPAKATELAAFRCNLCSTATAEITNRNIVPGGVDKVLRPHEYEAYGSPKEMTYVSATALADTVGADGDTYLNRANNTLYTKTAGAWVAGNAADAYTIYYGANPVAAADDVYSRVYSSGDGNYSGVAGKKGTVDFADALGGNPPATIPAGAKAGARMLDSDTGTIYTLNANATAWLPATTAAEEGTIYSVKSGANANKLFAYDSNHTAGDEMSDVSQAVGVATPGVMMDTATSSNLFVWQNGVWGNLNLDPRMGLAASSDSVTTQANMTAFGQDIMKNRDHEDKFYVYDSLGNPYTMIVTWRKVMDTPADVNAPTGAEAEWDWYAYYVDSEGVVQPQYGQGAGTMVFGDDGLLKRTYYYEPTPATPNPNATATTAPEYNWNVVEKVIGDPADDWKATGKVVADFNVSGGEGSATTDADGNPVYFSNMITLDFLGKQWGQNIGVDKDAIDGVTQFASTSTTIMYGQDGYEMGVLKDFTIGQDGTITGVYSNDKMLPIAQVALATFINPGGLTKVGQTCFAESSNSGTPTVAGAMTGAAGSIVGNTIEMSNTDLSEEFVNLIRAQRGFQASSRVITTSDQVLEELINLKR